MQVSLGYSKTYVTLGGRSYRMVFMVRVRPGSYSVHGNIWVAPSASEIRIVGILLS
jgi:hypothetical protein